MSQPLPPPVPNRAPQVPPHNFPATMLAVILGVVGGLGGLVVLAVILGGRDGGEWVGTIALGLGILACVEVNNWRKRRGRWYGR